jgi:hypothetical protein
LQASVERYRCPGCKGECRPLLDVLGVEAGRICGSLTRLLALLAVVAPQYACQKAVSFSSGGQHS